MSATAFSEGMRVMGLRRALMEADLGGWDGPEGDCADIVIDWQWYLSGRR